MYSSQLFASNCSDKTHWNIWRAFLSIWRTWVWALFYASSGKPQTRICWYDGIIFFKLLLRRHCCFLILWVISALLNFAFSSLLYCFMYSWTSRFTSAKVTLSADVLGAREMLSPSSLRGLDKPPSVSTSISSRVRRLA